MSTSTEVPEQLGKYKIVARLGRGAMGMVYKGYDPLIKRYVALKTVSSDLLDMDDSKLKTSIARFKREAQSAGRLNHPNIVSVYEYGEDDGTLYIAMEYVEGRELKKIFTRKMKFRKLSQVLHVMTQLLDALQHSHENGVVHRDIKPGNIIVTPNGDIKVADFGIARIESSELTQIGTLMGTPSYMSPEVLRDEKVDARTDLFSAGIVFYQLLTSEKPFDGGTPIVMNKILNDRHIPPSAINPDLSRAFDDIIDKALAKNPEDRYQTAVEFSLDLKRAMAGYPENTVSEDAVPTEDETVILPSKERPAQPDKRVSSRTLASYKGEGNGTGQVLSDSHKQINKILMISIISMMIALGAVGYVLFTGEKKQAPLEQKTQQQAEKSGMPDEQPGPGTPAVGSPSPSETAGGLPDAGPKSSPAASQKLDAVSTETTTPVQSIIEPEQDIESMPKATGPSRDEEVKSTETRIVAAPAPPEVEEETATEPVPAGFTLRSERERDRVQLRFLSELSGTPDIEQIRSVLKLATGFVNSTTGSSAGKLPGFLDRALPRMDILSSAVSGPVDVIAELSVKDEDVFITLHCRFFTFGEAESIRLKLDKYNPENSWGVIYKAFSKLYCFNAMNFLEKSNQGVSTLSAGVKVAGSTENTLYIGNKTDICISPDQSSHTVVLNINSGDITLLFPNYQNPDHYLKKGASRCTGSMDIYPPDGVEMICVFLLKEKVLLKKFGYVLTEQTPYYSWGHDGGKAVGFSENLILKLMNESGTDWSAVNHFLLIKRK